MMRGMRKRPAAKPVQPIAFDTYESRAPSAQNAIDALAGWNTAFPTEYGVRAGAAALFDDARIAWGLEQFGSIEGKFVLELGPLEGAHTHFLTSRGATVEAVEANRQAFLRCLVTKEIARIQNATFLLGDFLKYLETTTKRYDLIVASGVLYHMNDPVRLLELIAAHTDAVFLWTHYVDVEALPEGDPRRAGYATTSETRDLLGETLQLYRRSYVNANLTANYCGGAIDEHRWMDRGSILRALKALGLSQQSIAHESHDNPFGPAFSVFARRP